MRVWAICEWFCRMLGHLCLTWGQGGTRGELMLVMAEPWAWGQILGTARGHCCGLNHTECCFYNLDLVMSAWNKRLFSCLCAGEENLGCICLHSCVKPPGSVGLDSSAALVFPTYCVSFCIATWECLWFIPALTVFAEREHFHCSPQIWESLWHKSKVDFTRMHQYVPGLH